MEPTGTLSGSAGNQDYAVGPTRNQVIRIVNAIRISKAITFGQQVAFPAGTKKCVHAPQLTFPKEQLQESCASRSLTKSIAIAEKNGFPGDAQHLLDHRRRICSVM